MPGELTPVQWEEAFKILKDIGVDFNIILGNEPWLFGKALAFMKNVEVPYAMYTTAPEPLFSKNVDYLFGENILSNLSMGIDFPNSNHKGLQLNDDSYWKSQAAWRAFKYVRKKYPQVDTHGTITVHRLNYQFLPKIFTELQDIGVHAGINFIHWDKDGKFDFFSDEAEMTDLLFREKDYSNLRKVLDEVLQLDKGFLQDPEFLQQPVAKLVEMGWHCQGDPYGGPTIDADGSLRVCGYRKGTHTPKFKIWDLKDPVKVKQWQEAVKADAMECPGCAWQCPWMYSYWKKKEPDFGTDVFVKQSSKKLSKE